jgi:hypothetical protein
MASRRPTSILVVAHQPAGSPQLVEAVAQRAARGRCAFTLLVPRRAHGLHRVVDAEDHDTADAFARLDAAVPLLSKAAGRPIIGMIGSHEPLATIQDALNLLGFDEVIISVLPVRISRWSHLDLPRKVRALGVPVTEVIDGDHMTDVPAP